MDTIMPIDWEQGLFLQPQHFQLSDLFQQQLALQYARLQTPYFWGLANFYIDTTLLENNIFSLSSAEMLLQDGGYVNLPQNAVLLSRSFADVLKQKVDSFQVYLGVKVLQDSVPNVTEVSDNNLNEVDTRYVVNKMPAEIDDLYNTGPKASVKQLKFAIRIFWDTEISQIQNYSLMPIAKLNVVKNGIEIDKNFIPPCLTLQSSDALRLSANDFFKQLMERVKSIESLKQAWNTYSSTSTENGKMQLLHVLSGFVAKMNVLLKTPLVHPFSFYLLLTELLGKLSSYTTSIDVLGISPSGTVLLPEYTHENLSTTIGKTCALVSTVLNQLMLGNKNLVQAQKENNIYLAAPEAAFFSSNNHFYLLIQFPNTTKDLSIQKGQMKLCAYTDMANSLEYSLPGIQLTQLQSVPSGIPNMANCLYFSIDKSSSEWIKIEQEQKIAVYLGTMTQEVTVNIAGAEEQ